MRRQAYFPGRPHPPVPAVVPCVRTTQKSSQREEMPDFMPNYLELPIGPKCPEVVNAVIEIPLEGINKYEYDKELHVFRLDRNLYSPVHYPGDYGFPPPPLGDDGTPPDCLVLVD